jgi:hypothetical protein
MEIRLTLRPGLSQLEYEEAISLRLPCLIYLMEVEKIIGEVIRKGRERIAAETAKIANEEARDA